MVGGRFPNQGLEPEGSWLITRGTLATPAQVAWILSRRDSDRQMQSHQRARCTDRFETFEEATAAFGLSTSNTLAKWHEVVLVKDASRKRGVRIKEDVDPEGADDDSHSFTPLL